MQLAERIVHMLADGPRFTRQIAAELDVRGESVAAVCRCLRHKGWVCGEGGLHGLTRHGQDELARGGFIPCRRKGRAAASAGRTLRQRAWAVMRMADHFSVDSLLRTVSDGEERNAENNLTNYCRALYRAGFLGRMARTRAFFLRAGADTGPLAPAYNRAEKCVTDRNTGRTIFLEGNKHA